MIKKFGFFLLILGIGLVYFFTQKQTEAPKTLDQASTVTSTTVPSVRNAPQVKQQEPATPVALTETPAPVSRKEKAPEHLMNRKPSMSYQPQAQELRPFHMKPEWQVWNNVMAIHPSASDDIYESSLGKVGGYNLVSVAENTGSTEDKFNSGSPIAVYDPRLGRAGVVTGTVKIKTGRGASIVDIQRDHDLEILNSFSNLNLYFVTARVQPFSLSGLFKNLSSDARITRAEIEIVSKSYDKK